MWQTNLKIVLLVLGTLATYTLVASSIPQVQSEVPEELSFTGEVSAAELVAAGEELFNGAGGCTACHGLGTRAPNLRSDHAGQGSIGARCGGRVEGEDCKAYIYQSLTDPAAYVVDGFEPIMPDVSRTLSQTQIWAMVAYLQSQGGDVTVSGADIESTAGAEGGGTPAGSVSGGAAATGGAAGAATTAGAAAGGTDPVAIIENNLCLNCHVLDERGVELGPSFNGVGARLDADAIRHAILDPNADASEGFEQLKGVMPTNFGQIFTAAQLEALVTYLANRR